jgi:hypothetical protein
MLYGAAGSISGYTTDRPWEAVVAFYESTTRPLPWQRNSTRSLAHLECGCHAATLQNVWLNFFALCSRTQAASIARMVQRARKAILVQFQTTCLALCGRK